MLALGTEDESQSNIDVGNLSLFTELKKKGKESGVNFW